MVTSKKKTATVKKTAKKTVQPKFETYSITIDAAGNGYVIEEDRKNSKTGEYTHRKSIYVSTDALLTALEPMVRELRDREASK